MIRTATIDDVYRIAEIHVMGWRFAYRNIISEDYLYKTMHISKRVVAFTKHIEERNEETYVFEENQIIKAFMTIGRCRDSDKPDCYELWGLYYDIWALAYFMDICDDPEKIEKINDIILYILDPEFQKIREGYGLIWVKDRRIYHACGWSPTLPLYQIEGRLMQAVPYPMIDYLDFMSHFKLVHSSKWFKDCLNHLEQFRTEKGTYLFPKEYLRKKYSDKAFLDEENLYLKRNERELIKREVVSTMKMLEIHRRL